MRRVRFPAEHAPLGAAIHTLDTIDLELPIERVWAKLIRASEWSRWYANCSDLRFDPDTPGPDLELGTEFAWRTFGTRVHTRVEEFEPLERLAWSGRAVAGVGYHGWVLEPRPRGCRVVTEEVQRGWLPRAGRWILEPRLHRWHRRWLRGLAE